MTHCIRNFVLVSLGLSLTFLVKADIAVIVHPNNPIETLSHKDVQRLFLGRSLMFPHSTTKIYAIDHSDNSPTYNGFYEDVINMKSNKLKKYRAYYLFSGKGRLPLSLVGTANVINQVAETENAISYINTRYVSDKVKVVFTMP
jgi:ABC-type phosphate transport system substrate-binding protein